jgi:hypothetical protein
MNSIPCKCGHNNDEHRIGALTGNPLCNLCVNKTSRGMASSYVYHEFQLDNLRYLEQRYEESLEMG